MAKFPTFRPWPWIGSYCIPSCITRWRLPTHQISLKSKKRSVDGRADVQTADRHLGPILLGRLGWVDLTSGQRILTKGRITGRQIFHGGQCSVTSTSREHCSRMQKSHRFTFLNHPRFSLVENASSLRSVLVTSHSLNWCDTLNKKFCYYYYQINCQVFVKFS